jgi:hypothetical protein
VISQGAPFVLKILFQKIIPQPYAYAGILGSRKGLIQLLITGRVSAVDPDASTDGGKTEARYC